MATSPQPPLTTARAGSSAATTLAHIVHMGQSLASGEDAFPVVTVADTGLGNFQFHLGVHTWRPQLPLYCQFPSLRLDSQFALVPIIGGEPASSTGETIASGLADSLTSSLSTGSDRHFLVSYAGVGNKRLRDLDKHDDTTDPRSVDPTPGGFYKTSIDDVRRARAQADAMGWNYEVAAITWMQGEKNNDYRLDDWTGPLDRASFLVAYAQDLIALKDEWNADIATVTSQSNRVPLFTYQSAGAISGQAQLLASDMDSEVHVVSPTYYMFSAVNSINPFSHAPGAAVHLTGDSERWLGAQYAKVIKRAVFDKQPWQPLRPMTAQLSADRMSIHVRYQVPVPPIVIDNAFMPAVPGAGLFIPGGPAIAAVSIEAADTIRLDLQSSLPQGTSFTLEYASEHGNATALELQGGALQVMDGAPIDAQPTYEVVVSGDIRAQLATSLQHGVFYLQNDPNAPGATFGVIRTVVLNNNGNTVLQGALRDLNAGVHFQVGQPLSVAMIFAYGNIRDSDSEQSIYKFVSGARAGQPYPLWNWSVAFEGLTIE